MKKSLNEAISDSVDETLDNLFFLIYYIKTSFLKMNIFKKIISLIFYFSYIYLIFYIIFEM